MVGSPGREDLLLTRCSTESRRRARTRRNGTGRVNPAAGFLGGASMTLVAPIQAGVATSLLVRLSSPAPNRSFKPNALRYPVENCLNRTTLRRGVCSFGRLCVAINGFYGVTNSWSRRGDHLAGHSLSPAELLWRTPRARLRRTAMNLLGSAGTYFHSRRARNSTSAASRHTCPATAGLSLRHIARVASLEFVLRVVMGAPLYKRPASGSSLGCLPVDGALPPWFIATKAASRRITP